MDDVSAEFLARTSRTVTLTEHQAEAINHYIRIVGNEAIAPVTAGQVLAVTAKLVPNGAGELEVLVHELAPGEYVTVPDPALVS